MKEKIKNILEEYLLIFSDEQIRQLKLINYLEQYNDEEITDWNNFNGHIVASGFIYAVEDKKFLVMYHNDMKLFTYPGGHIDSSDKQPLDAAIREVKEETGLNNFKEMNISNNKLVPIDIDTHIINYNERLNLPEHYHFDFRYLFVVDKVSDVQIDSEELSNFKWIDIEELVRNYGEIVNKINMVI